MNSLLIQRWYCVGGEDIESLNSARGMCMGNLKELTTTPGISLNSSDYHHVFLAHLAKKGP